MASLDATSERACGVLAPAKPGRGLEKELVPKVEVADENVAMRGTPPLGLPMLLTADAEAPRGAPLASGLSMGDPMPLEAFDHVRDSPRRAASSSAWRAGDHHVRAR